MEEPTEADLQKYESKFSPAKFADKIATVAKKAGVKTVYAALLLYYAVMDGDVPLKHKAMVVGALGYFILPLDFIPDVLGPLGYTDDLTTLVIALKAIWNSITPAVHSRARTRLEAIFGPVEDSDLKLF
ncbi:MAG: DUF1232 domain-containing protein [Muribaculaceae bacterium]|nr:DUF1232 domain-containing protein [Muribaculaceae bacterium]